MTHYRSRVFPLLAGVLWAVFLFLDVTNTADSTWVKYTAICLCCLTALLGAGTFDGRLVAAALCFTVVADWFLLVRDEHYTLGVCLFIIVQLLYAYRLSRLEGGSRPVFRARLALSALFLGLSLFPLWCAALYFINLCLNTAGAWIRKRRGSGGVLISRFAWGLLLFVCCDICVGAWNLGLFPGFTRVGMWLFYLPSQVLIVLSQEEKEVHHEKRL